MGILSRALAVAGVVAGGMAGVAAGQATSAAYPTPTLDRWVYTFGSQPGAEAEATVFSILGSGFESTFDIRDGQFLVGYATAPSVPSGAPVANYRLISARVVAKVSRDKVFRYDPTFDVLGTYLPATDPGYVADSDVGRPVEMFAVGYRNGLSAASFMENTPFAFVNPAQKSVRNAYAAQYSGAGATGALVDVSNNTFDFTGTGGPAPYEVRPIAIGTAAVTPGLQVDIGTEFTFDIDFTNPDALRHVREGLAGGRLNLMITSMTATSQQSSTTPAFWTKEGPTALGAVPARLELAVCIGAPGDWNCSGAKGVQDIFDFLTDYFAGNADFNYDGATSVQDIFDFLAAYFAA